MAAIDNLRRLEPRLLDLWSQDPSRGLSVRDIRHALGLTRQDNSLLRRWLQDLTRKQILDLKGSRFTLAIPPAPAPAREKDRPGQARQLARTGGDGVYAATRRGFGFVELQAPRQSLFVPPGRAGGALDGDRVRVTIAPGRDGRSVAEVVTVLNRFRERVRGHLELHRREAWLIPLNERLPSVFLSAAPPKGLRNGDLVDARITRYPEDDAEAPSGEVLRAVPDDESPESIVGHILADQQIAEEFPPEAVRDAERAAQHARWGSGRENQEHLAYVTIDGEDARDFDDAVCLIPEPGERQRLLVAIADVAAYVLPGTALDREAYRRGTSIYLPHRAIPMLPEMLSNDLCSLRPGEPRLSLTCDMELDADGAVLDYRLYESVIRSRARLTYAQVQAYFDGAEAAALPDPELAPMLSRMRTLAQRLSQKRATRGALALNLAESRFELDGRGWPLFVRRVFPTEATRLIEQFMLEANEQVARHAETHRLPILYRVHDPPPPDQLDSLRLLLHNAGVAAAEGELRSPLGINRVLARLVEHPRQGQLQFAVLRAMTQAQYRITNDGHFGLASDCYTHFTSPIRRYPDLLVHRALKSSMAVRGTRAAPPAALPAHAGEYLSDRERIADSAEQQVQRLFKVLMMEPRLGEIFPASVSGVAEAGLWVELQDLYVDGFLPLEGLPSDRYRLDRERNVLRGQRHRREIGFGTRLTVRLVRADRHQQRLEMGFEAWGTEARKPADSASAARSLKPSRDRSAREE